MILGPEQEKREFKKFIGVGEFNVLGFNFDRQTIIDKCGYDPNSDPVYTGKLAVKSGNDTVDARTANVSAFLKEVNTGAIMRLGFLMKEADDISNAGNVKYVNNKCQNSYVLLDWFTKNDYRKAYVGEADFLHFVRNWLSNFKWFEDGEAGARYPLKEDGRLFDGNFKALNDLAVRYTKQTVGVLCGIRESDRGQKQDTCNRAFVPGWMVSSLQQLNVGMSEEDIKAQKYPIAKFIEKVEGAYGYKNFYGNSYAFREYDPKTNVVAGSRVVNDELSY